MMSQTKSKTTAPIPKWKIALIPVLVVVLIVVLLPKSEEQPPTATVSTANETHPAANLNASNISEEPQASRAPLKTYSIAETLAYDPFHLGEPLKKLFVAKVVDTGPTPEELAQERARLERQRQRELLRQQLLEKVQALRVSLIVKTPQGYAAHVGSDTVRVGDELEPGVIVTQIDESGIQVSLKEGDEAE